MNSTRLADLDKPYHSVSFIVDLVSKPDNEASFKAVEILFYEIQLGNKNRIAHHEVQGKLASL